MSKQNRSNRLLLLALLLLAIFLYFYAEAWLRAVLLYLSAAGWARRLVTRFPPAWYVASRFVAGETIDDAMRATAELNAEGITATMDYLGESITDPSEANVARDEILDLLDAIQRTGVNAGVSVKLSQIGLKIDPDLALDNMRRILARARRHDLFVRIDMEESKLVDATLSVYRTLAGEGFENTGVVIQSYLYRSEADLRRLIAEGASVRLCKGAYKEPPHIAFADKRDVDENFVRLMQLLLSNPARENGVYAGIATHDEAMIRATVDYVKENAISPDAFEFQMLYGVRREFQRQLVEEGYKIRVYVPYGSAWYPYFMRRLAERPANLWFFIVNFFRR